MRVTATLLALVLLAGCGSRMATTAESWQPNARIAVPVGAMWAEHPVKGGFEPPVAMIGNDEPVRILKNHFGFTRIQLSDLRTGWVARGTAMR